MKLSRNSHQLVFVTSRQYNSTTKNRFRVLRTFKRKLRSPLTFKIEEFSIINRVVFELNLLKVKWLRNGHEMVTNWFL